MTETRHVLLWVVALLAALAAAVLWEVLGTVFSAITLVYVAAPLYRELVDRGLRPWWASALTTATVFVAAMALFAPFAVVLYQRRTEVLALLDSLPETVTVGSGEFAVVLVTGDLVEVAAGLVRSLALDIAAAAPVLGVKVTVLGMVVFALLARRAAVGRAIMAAVPWRHRQVVRRLGDRVRETLVAIYVLQAATALGTFVVAFVLFALLGYRFAFVLAVVAGLLQFLPVVGPSVLVVGMAAADLLAGDGPGALLVGVVGWLLVAALPDVLVHPRLAERTAPIPGSLYFIGFAGGLLTVGAVGVIAGPVVVVLLQEALRLLAAETDVAPGGRLVERDE